MDNNVEESELGWLMLCSRCNQHTATIRIKQEYVCRGCFSNLNVHAILNGDEEDGAAEPDEIKCECGAETVGGLHSSYCPKAD